MSKVSLVRCPSYEKTRLQPSLRKALDLLGGIEQFVKPGQKVFVKVNHLPPPSPPERGIVTHPAFVEEVLSLLLDTGARIRVGDDINTYGDGFSVSGLRQVCERLGVEIVNLREEGFSKVTIPDAEVLPQTYVAKAILDAEVIVNLPKFKTHSLTVFTGAIKNMYGCLPAGLKVRYHQEFQRVERFNTLLVDLFSFIRPQLHIMDAVVGMEGDGPANGPTRNIGLILAGSDAVALDRVALAVAGIDPENVYYLKKAGERKLGIDHLDRIEVCGENIQAVHIPDFKTSSVSLEIIKKWVPDFVFRAICRQFEYRPKVIASSCQGCKACEKVCPAGALKVVHNLAKIDRSSCIACMCCHEACRFNAIRSQRRLSARLMTALLRRLRKLVKN